ncbi:endoplasmic reticulum lectin 1 isoform X6 [Patella vulgata]|uniref:endoplasmic reticulum lectin 1 isoform X6 n=1 Tax=Patella vulgata TaxID=6465 RepID=UPI00217F2668|nr:endoplasmic reticulum lectin 1 isoform X6 [Patella vulgata]
MTLHNIFKTFVYLLLIEKKIQSFNPFMDNELFMINWAGPLLDIPTKKLDGSIVVMTKDEEKYQCILPESEEKRQENSKNYNGPTPDELMEALFTQSACSYRDEGIVKEEITVSDGDTINKVKVYHTPKATTPPTPTLGPNTDKQILRDFLSSDYCLQGGTGWWKHEFCYNKHARQYHDGPEGRQVIYLGHWNFQKHLEWLQKHPSKRPKEKDSRKHISLLYTDGDICDLTGNKRITEVRLKCIPNEQHPHAVALYLMEPSPCNYILGVSIIPACIYYQHLIESPLFCSLLMKADDDGIFTLADVKGL